MAIVDRELARIAEHLQRLQDLQDDLLVVRSRLSEALDSGVARPGGVYPCLRELVRQKDDLIYDYRDR